MRRPTRSIRWLILAGTLLVLAPALVHAQTQQRISNIPSTNPNGQQQQEEPDDPLGVTETNVGILDPAVPMTMMRVRVDLGYDNPRPFRSEFFLAKPMALGGRGILFPETKINSYQEASAYGEYALYPFLSTFAEIPYRWLNPDVNSNAHGTGDVNFGLKLCTFNMDNIIATFQLRIYNPTGSAAEGTRHWTAEPALLGSYKFLQSFLLEGQFRYWAPLGGSDFAGNMMIYGVGLSYGTRNSASWWFAPVAEGVGWTALSGQTLVASSPTDYFIQDARGQTIANGYLGVRIGYGSHIDGYIGYGHCFTGDTMWHDFARAELRLMY